MRIMNLATGVVMGLAAVSAVPAPAAAVGPFADVAWWNPTTGAVSTWMVNGAGKVSERRDLDWRCDTRSGCATEWKPVAAGDLNADGVRDVSWWNRATGEVSAWLVSPSRRTVLRKQVLSWRCDTASGCAGAWQPIGHGDLNADGRTDLTWWNAATGEVSTWLLNGAGRVLSKHSLDWRCDTKSGCATDWRPVGIGDVDNNGLADVVWHNRKSGVVSSWLMDPRDPTTVKAKQDLGWKCAVGTGCSVTWSPVGLGDLDGNGYRDLVWYDPAGGVVSGWRLNGLGTVLGKQDLDWKCGAASGCRDEWRLLGVVG